MKIIEFEAICKERIWGGRRLETSLGKMLPGEKEYGESWDIVDRDEDQSVVADGDWKGLTISELLDLNGEYIMGPKWEKGRVFPVLVKWLDCRKDLSLQVHPPKEVAVRLNGEAKTENWYIVESDPGAKICVGLKAGIGKDDLKTALNNGEVEDLLNWIETRGGDSIFIPSGRLHAIGGGNLLLEIQENSDTTYRVWDWGRKDLDGRARELHIKEALVSINFNDTEPKIVVPDGMRSVIVDCEEFRITKWLIKKKEMVFKEYEEPKILSIVEGELQIKDKEGMTHLKRGRNILLPYGETFRLESDIGCTILVTDRFI